MAIRHLSPLDRLLAGANNALRTVAAPAGRPSRPYPAKDVSDDTMSDSQRNHAAGLMRVNHAGEVAAQALYKGHALVARDKALATHLEAAANEEFDHLAWCEQRLTELNNRPSRLTPVWYAGAYAIGAASGALGDQWSLGFIAETEHQVCRHLEQHLKELPEEDSRSRVVVETMRDEEAQHGQDAKDRGAADLPGPINALMRLTSKVMTRTAYWV